MGVWIPTPASARQWSADHAESARIAAYSRRTALVLAVVSAASRADAMARLERALALLP